MLITGPQLALEMRESTHAQETLYNLAPKQSLIGKYGCLKPAVVQKREAGLLGSWAWGVRRP